MFVVVGACVAVVPVVAVVFDTCSKAARADVLFRAVTRRHVQIT